MLPVTAVGYSQVCPTAVLHCAIQTVQCSQSVSQPTSQSVCLSVSTKDASSNLKPSLPRLHSAISQYHTDHTCLHRVRCCSLADIIPAQTSHTDCREVRHSCMPAYLHTYKPIPCVPNMRTYMHPLHTVYLIRPHIRIFCYLSCDLLYTYSTMNTQFWQFSTYHLHRTLTTTDYY